MTKTAREKIGESFVLADTEKNNRSADITHQGFAWGAFGATSYRAMDRI